MLFKWKERWLFVEIRLQKPAREHGLNAGVGCQALAHARASANLCLMWHQSTFPISSFHITNGANRPQILTIVSKEHNDQPAFLRLK